MLTLRGYQSECKQSINDHISSKGSNPCAVIPTGGGKSLIMASLLTDWIQGYGGLRAMVLADRKELVRQNAEELIELSNDLNVGVFCAGLRRRDTMSNITFASIGSVYDKSDQFPVQDVLIIDEADMIPLKGEGRYRRFLFEMRERNPNITIIGLTATPYRMDGGPICHKDHILNEICYEANLGDLISQGYLCALKTVRGAADIDLSGVKKSNGDYSLKDLSLRVDRTDIVAQAVRHMMECIRKHDRKSIAIFGIDIDHCKHIQQELVKYGVSAQCVFGGTPTKERDRIVDDFKNQRLKYVISVDTLNVGFNAKCVDCVAMFRPTQSKRIWVQTVGRGLRLHPSKSFTLVLDYGENINRHGPLDLMDQQGVKLVTCGDCGNEFSRAVKCCPSCGWEIPPVQREAFEAAEQRERSMHAAVAGDGLLLNEPKWMDVDGVTCRLHKKAGKPDSLRVDYHCGMSMIKEWVGIDHPGYAGDKAQAWLSQRGLSAGSVADFLGTYTGADVFKRTARILVRYEGKYLKIINYELK